MSVAKANLLVKIKEEGSQHFHDIHTYESEELKILFLMYILKDVYGTNSITPGEIEKIMSDVCGLDIPRQRIMAILWRQRGTVKSQKIGQKIHFAIMQPGIELVNASRTQSIVMIDPTTAFSGIRKLQQILAELVGDIRICDPYVDSKTLDFLVGINPRCNIKLLTMTINDPRALKRDYTAYKNQYGNLEMKVVQSKVLHDRYIIDDNSMFLLGQSLNGVGKKQTFIVNVGTDLREQTMVAFNKYWSQAPEFN